MLYDWVSPLCFCQYVKANPSPPWADVICKWSLCVHIDIRSTRDSEHPTRLSGKPSAYFSKFFSNFFGLGGAHVYVRYVCYCKGDLDPSDWALLYVPDWTQKTCVTSGWQSLYAGSGSHNSCKARSICCVELHTTTSCVVSRTCNTHLMRLQYKSLVQSALLHSTRNGRGLCEIEWNHAKGKRAQPCM